MRRNAAQRRAEQSSATHNMSNQTNDNAVFALCAAYQVIAVCFVRLLKLCHGASRRVASRRVASRYVMSCHVMSCHVM